MLSLVGVEPETVAADYGLSDERLRSLYLSRGEADQAPGIAEFLRDQGTTATRVITETLAELDVEALLLDAGLERSDLSSLRSRLLG